MSGKVCAVPPFFLQLCGSRRNEVKRAFTLIELLVVVAIIAILAAILFPVLSQAKQAAKKTQSIAQIRQITLAWRLYNADFDDMIMRASLPAGSKTIYWWGSFDGSTLVEREGLLYPYMKSAQIQVDPTFPSQLRTALGLTGYGYNYHYLSPSDYLPPNYEEMPIPVSESQIASTSETLAFASAARIDDWSGPSPVLQGNTFIDPPSFDYPGVHGRAANHAVVAWTDGHVASRRPDLRSIDFGYGHSAEAFRRENLGDILKPGCPVGSGCQDYFYSLAKDE